MDRLAAAVGICSRQGLWKLRHIGTHTLWVQDNVRIKAMKFRKVRGSRNLADFLTKHTPSQDKFNQLATVLGCAFDAGRVESAPLLRKHRPDDVAGKGIADEASLKVLT